MYQHIVLWTFQPGLDKSACVQKLQQTFAGIEEKIPGLQKLTIHQGAAGYDACLISIHDDLAALEVYNTHPAHVACKEVVHTMSDKRASIDFAL